MSLLGELKRRHVLRVAAVYGAVAWAVLQGAGTNIPLLELPAWTGMLVVALVALGLPLALVRSWAYDLTPDGLKRTAGEDPATRTGALVRSHPPKWILAVSVLAAVAVIAAAAWRYHAVRTSPTVVAGLPFSARGDAA